MKRFFAPDGPLSAQMPGYALRPAQLEMATEIAKCLSEDRGRLIAEAGTGTGKSLAYLAAALMSDKKVVISTATKTLQDQLFYKDLPLAIDIVKKLTGESKRAIMMKGRGNYLCLHKSDNWHPTTDMFRTREPELVTQIRRFIKTTSTGDRSELTELPDDSPLWSEISAKADTCLGQECSLYNDCFVTQMRRQAQGADIIVVNHSLLCADRSLRVTGGDQAFSPIIPNADAWIIDEAHALVDIATRHFGVAVSSLQLKMLARDLASVIASVNLVDQPAFKQALDSLVASFEKEKCEGLLECLRVIDVNLTAIISRELGERKAGVVALSRRVSELTTELVFMLSNAAADAGYVTYSERDNRGLVLSASPIDVAQVLSRAIWSVDASIVLTSATLVVHGKMDAFMRQSGFNWNSDDVVSQHVWPAPFDFENRSALYVPNHISAPNEESFQVELESEIQELLKLSKGGAFLLFTSHRAMNLTYQNLKEHLEDQGLVVLKQGDAPKLELIAQFTQADSTWGAVLFATHSFWEGVDVRGKALRLVVIDRLPFKSPEDPIVKARTDRLQKQGLSAFALMSLPEAALTLKQGAGRLLRTHQDAGVVALLDNRVLHKGYGKILLETLPPMRSIRQRDELKLFWKNYVVPHFV